ncbi:MAG: hypothetical protein RMJ44_06310 [Cytophagales bacterium]|nr:hypothetical protein [Bernardetiaceae bacterium]MDW8210683.1 hypothetical protein [Cytophagales bacterium]
MWYLFVVAFFLIELNLTAQRNYYLAANGNDKADGKIPQSAWKTLARLATVHLKPKDSLFFKRGDTFPGAL